MPIVTYLGFDVPVFTIAKGCFSKLGKSLKKHAKIESHDLPSVGSSLSAVKHDLENSVMAFERARHDVLLVQSNASLDIVFHLNQLANERSLHLLAAVRVHNLDSLIGYALCKVLPAGVGIDSLLRPRLLHMLVNHQNTTAGSQWESPRCAACINSLERKFCDEIFLAFNATRKLPLLPADVLRICVEFSSTPGQIVMNARSERALREVLDRRIVGLVLDYAYGMSEALPSIRLISNDSWDWLFCYTITVAHIPQEISLLAQRAAEIIQTHKLRSSYTWRYTLFGRENFIYFWNRSMRPLTTLSTPPELKDLLSMLQHKHPFMSSLHECLPAVYDKPNHRLRWHQDDEGRAYHHMAEALALIFTGSPRRLNFKPCFSMYPHLETIYSLKCLENFIVFISPLANEIFYHSKARSTCSEPSVTLAWRRGIPIEKAKSLYPHLSKFKSLGS